MKRLLRLRPSPATVIACIALVVALGETGYSATGKLLPRNSVGTKQVLDGSLRTVDLSSKAKAALRGARGQQGLPGPAGAQGIPGSQGVQGPSGVIQGVGAIGGGPNPTGTTQFFSVPATVTVSAPTQRVLVSSHNAFGTSGASGTALNIFICYQQPGGAITPSGNGMLGLKVPPNTRVPMGMSKVLTLPVGEYSVGLCGTGGAGWDSNDWGTTTALVFVPQQ